MSSNLSPVKNLTQTIPYLVDCRVWSDRQDANLNPAFIRGMAFNQENMVYFNEVHVMYTKLPILYLKHHESTHL